MLGYQELQPANIVTAVTTGHITTSSSLQLVMFKKDMVEVWEINDVQQILIVAESMQFGVVDCVLLQAPFPQLGKEEDCSLGGSSLSGHLDKLLIMDCHGRLCVLEWDGSLGLRESCYPVQVHKDNSEAFQMHSNNIFSSPLLLLKDAATSYYSTKERVSGYQKGNSELQGITLVGLSVDTASLEVGVVEWSSPAKSAPMSSTHARGLTDGTFAPKLMVNLDLLELKQYLSTAICSNTAGSGSLVLSVAFLGAVTNNTGRLERVLDMKGRPLLAVLSTDQTGLSSSSTGCSHQALSVQCFALDLIAKELQQGPWKMSNLHPTTSFVLPWSYQDKGASLTMGQATEAPVDCGVEPGLGVLLISSSSLLFIESSGRRSSVGIGLKGLPTCYDVSSNQCLIVGDSSGALHIMDLSEWTNFQKQRLISDTTESPTRIIKVVHPSPPNAEAECNDLHGGNKLRILYLGDTLGKSDFFVLRCHTGISHHSNSSLLPPIMSPEKRDVPACGEHATGSTLLVTIISWTAEKLHVKSSSLETIAPVRDALCVRTRDSEGEQSLLAVCGATPTAATLKRGDLAVVFCLDVDVDLQIRGLPLLLPFKAQWELQYDTHILLSYPDQNSSTVVAVDSSKPSHVIIDALDRQQCTLAIAMFPGGMLVQVTRISLIVLSISGRRVFKVEWTPPLRKEGPLPRRNDLSHAALTVDGAVLARGHILYAVQLNRTGGMPRTTATSNRLHQVSALSILDVGNSTNVHPSVVVILGLWISNSLVILSWPQLEDLSCIYTDGGPIRSVSGAVFRGQYFLCAGTADGYLLCYKLMCNAAARITSQEQDPENLICKQASKLPRNRTRSDWSTNSGQKLKVGESEVRIEFGRFKSCKTVCRQGGRDQAECLLAQSNSLLAVVLPDDSQYLQALSVHGLNSTCLFSTSAQVADYPSSMVCLSTSGQLLFGHLDMSVSLRWKSTPLPGCPRDLTYHSTSTCALISCMEETGSWNLAVIQVPSMCQVFTLKLGSFHPVVLKDVVWEEYIALVCERAKHAMGHLFLFDLSYSRISEEQSEYKLRLVGQQSVELPCYSLCLLKLPDAFSFDATQTLAEEAYAPSVLRQDTDRALIKKAQTGALLALGGRGKVQLLSIFVVDPGISTSMLAALSGAVDAALPFHDAQHNQYYELEGDWALDEGAPPEEVCDKDEDVQYFHPAKSKTCLMNLQHVTSFTTVGGGHVTELIPGSEASLTVVEYLHGVNIFQVCNQAKVVQLAWQPFKDPIQCLMSLSHDAYLVDSQGLSLFRRNRAIEVQFQIEETQRDLERQSTITSNEHQPVDESQVHFPVEMGLDDTKPDRLPGLERLATIPAPSPALRIFPGRLGLYASPILNTECEGLGCAHAIVITPSGQVGHLSVAL